MANSLNKAMLIGNLTRDPELRQTTGGQQVCSFGIATNRSWKNAAGEKQEAADFHNVVVWGKLAEICAKYLQKGKKVYIEGRLQTRDWEATDGQKKSRTEIVAEDMVMLSGGAGQGGGAPFAQRSSAPVAADEPSAAPSDEIKLEDIPF